MPEYRANLQGVVYSAEAFQHGFTVTSAEQLTAVADDIAAGVTADLLTSTFLQYFPAGVSWSLLTVSQLGAIGDPVVASTTRSITGVGTASTNGLPPQCSVVVSFLTAGAGSRNRGRMYLPPTSAGTLTTTGRLASAAQGAIADAVEALFDGLIASGQTVTVRSEVGGGASSVVSTIRVGDVIDTQRRRRGSLGENYVARTIA